MDILKIALLALGGVLLAVMLKQTKPEYSMLISIGVCICIFIFLLSRLQTVLNYLKQLEAVVQLDGIYLETVLKMLGITYIAQFASDICKDAGYHAISGQIELFARISILFLSFPVLYVLVQTIQEVL